MFRPNHLSAWCLVEEGNTMIPAKSCIVLIGALALGACAVTPDGPTVMALPGKDKSFPQFQQDDASCRGYAAQQIGASPQQQANQAGVNSAIVGTLVGGAAGAAIGAAAGNPALGAAIGAGSGLALGSAAGANAAGYTGAMAQQRYDMSYIQCMVGNGENVPPPQMAGGPGPYGAPYPYAYGYPYPYAYPYYPYAGFYGAPFVVGAGWGWGWGGGWHGGGGWRR
jgi:hypothetical protein